MVSSAFGSPRYNLQADSESQIVQNVRADSDNLSRMENYGMVERYTRLELLVSVPVKTNFYYLYNLRSEYRYLRPWAKMFLDRLSRQFHSKFGKPLRVTSLLRTAEYQDRLSRRNGNAAPSSGEKRSAHLTGASLDISKKGLTAAQNAWLRRVLHSLHQKERVFAIEEFRQPNFHVLVHRNYLDHVEGLAEADD
jgi:hypothetical protein